MSKYKIEKETHLSRNLKILMRDHNINVRQLAELTGLAKSTIHGWLTGVNPISYDKIFVIANHFGVAMSWLLTGKVENAKYRQSQNTFSYEENGDIFFDGYVSIIIKRLIPKERKRDAK